MAETAKPPRRVSVLVVDDAPDHRNGLARAFKMAEARDFRFEVSVAEGLKDYHRILKERAPRDTSEPLRVPPPPIFDVLVVDVLLSETVDGVDDVVRFHRLYSPATTIIVCSAFQRRDKVRACVDAMKAGAADCIDKAAEDWRAEVVASAVHELRQRFSPDHGPSGDWLDQHLDELVLKYPGKAIAFLGEDVVASADTVGQLRAKLPALDLKGIPYFMVVPQWVD